MNEQQANKTMEEAREIMDKAQKALEDAQHLTPAEESAAEKPAERGEVPLSQTEVFAAQKEMPGDANLPYDGDGSVSTPKGNPDEKFTGIPSPAGEVIPKKKSKAKIIVPVAVAAGVILLAAIVFVVFRAMSHIDEYIDFDDPENNYVDFSVNNYYTGVVEPQKTSTVSRDPERTIGKVYVEVGDSVKKGDKLFSYDAEETEMKLNQAQLEYDGINNEITGYNNQIAELTRQRAGASEDQQLEYTVQIQECESYKAQSQVSLKMKQVEIDNLKKSLENADVTSPIDGIVKQINSSSTDADAAYMTILMTGSYQVKGKVDEFNVGMLYEGMSVIVHSRIDDSMTWEGTITKIDTESTADDGGSNYYDYSDSGSDEQATKYYFYASLSTSENLLLGQHVFIEPVFDDDYLGEDEYIDDEYADVQDAEPQG